MPLGLLNFNNFWDDPEKAELLASFIAPHVTNPAGFDARRTDGAGNIIIPGQRVVPRAGPDRVTQPNSTITLNANASSFANSYRWAVTVSPLGSTPVLSSPGSMRTDFTGDIVGSYTIQLTATSSENGDSRSDTLSVVVDAGLATAPRDLLFYGDINTEIAANCTAACHSNGGQAGVPVWWEEAQPFAVPPAGTPQLSFYEQFLTRVNFDDLEDSLVLKKPSNNHHFGGLVTGFDTSVGVGSASRDTYDMFVNWIAEGAACGGTTDQCVR